MARGEGIIFLTVANRADEIFEAIAPAVQLAAWDLDRAEILDDFDYGIQAVPRHRVHPPRILALLETPMLIPVKSHVKIVHAFDLDHTETPILAKPRTSLPKNLAVVIVLLYY